MVCYMTYTISLTILSAIEIVWQCLHADVFACMHKVFYVELPLDNNRSGKKTKRE